ncbi:hypothetical protein PJF56_15335 [Roseofilum sp. BLCC_M91]|uniref:Uncharacterized protein n=1 Tax=Roseofilum halophilum BLCC-M91 TaxID=3022259 RepID=A0ABT7BM38_9CYAN|nr:hypothetical protein [Roseofilum halophilum]MDJ1180236.1 hypothetical protein [Roseofilum halophilum BLCC-M91]
MNHKLVQSLVQIITSLSDEEQQYLEREIRRFSLAKQIKDLEGKVKEFEDKYQMPSDVFYHRFQSGHLQDSSDFFEWNTYHEMLTAAQVEVS